MSKTLIFCADGTWNGPDQDEDEDGLPDNTNVYKLFLALEGTLSPETLRNAEEQEKSLLVAGRTAQIAKYIHGVGDSRNPINKIIGGAFGAGIISRIVRGYTFLSRNYEPGDEIILVGFSRGAYTARALGGLIASQGLLAKPHTRDKEHAYRWGAKAWYRYRNTSKSARRQSFIKRLAEAVSDLPAFISADDIQEKDLVPVARVKAVAVWDTVGALGLPSYEQDTRIDAFRFSDNRLSDKVEWGFHALALDEQRLDFSPTFWHPRKNVIQAVFPGAHADVGGGYPTRGGESGLSNGALCWMVEQLNGIGVRFDPRWATSCPANPGGVAHQPWRHKPFNLPGRAALRTFAGMGVQAHDTIARRMALPAVVHEPGEAPARYKPRNLP
ncbi:MAG: DUF2235 domain-containing protein [Pseudomonadota bacterium]